MGMGYIFSELIINSTLLNIKDILSFTYKDEKNRISTLCIYVDLNTKDFFIAVCHNPFVDTKDLRFDITGSFKKWTYAKIKSMIAHQEISTKVLNIINEKLSPFHPDVVEQEYGSKFNLYMMRDKDLSNFNKIARIYTLEEISFKLWNKRVEIPNGFEEQGGDEILLVHPSLSVDLCKNTQLDGSILADPPTNKLHAGEALYEIKLHFIFQKDNGRAASYDFYMDILNQKCFLACCALDNHDHFECLFPIEQMPTENQVQEVLENEKLTQLSMNLLAKLLKLKALVYMNRDELKAQIKWLQKAFESEFDLEIYDSVQNDFQKVSPTEQSSDDILSKCGVWCHVIQYGVYVLELLYAFCQAVADCLSQVISDFCDRVHSFTF